MGFCWYQLLAVSAPILLDITVSEYYSILPKMHNIAQYYQYYSILPILLNTTNITQYYQYYSILLANMILEWSWIVPGYYSSVPNITQYYQYYQYYIILPILHNITHQRFTNITQYYISNITQYSIGGIQYQHYSILPISLNITYSILLNISNLQNCAFPIQYMSIINNISSNFQYSSKFVIII